MKLKEGMYARTEDGIKEIIDYEYDDEYENGHKIHFKGNKYGLMFTKEELPKCSWDLIDLIECLDIVELYIIGLEEDNITTIKRPETLRELKDLKKYIKRGAKIKSITTKEQFESISYKVGE